MLELSVLVIMGMLYAAIPVYAKRLDRNPARHVAIAFTVSLLFWSYAIFEVRTAPDYGLSAAAGNISFAEAEARQSLANWHFGLASMLFALGFPLAYLLLLAAAGPAKPKLLTPTVTKPPSESSDRVLQLRLDRS